MKTFEEILAYRLGIFKNIYTKEYTYDPYEMDRDYLILAIALIEFLNQKVEDDTNITDL